MYTYTKEYLKEENTFLNNINWLYIKCKKQNHILNFKIKLYCNMTNNDIKYFTVFK